jgi:DNA anti-recombination protein RmuC
MFGKPMTKKEMRREMDEGFENMCAETASKLDKLVNERIQKFAKVVNKIENNLLTQFDQAPKLAEQVLNVKSQIR